MRSQSDSVWTPSKALYHAGVLLPISSRVKKEATPVVTGININMSTVIPTKPDLAQSSYLIVLETLALFEVRERMP